MITSPNKELIDNFEYIEDEYAAIHYLVDALRAVDEIHSPYIVLSDELVELRPDIAKTLPRYCAGCGTHATATPFPCPTSEAIRKALEG